MKIVKGINDASNRRLAIVAATRHSRRLRSYISRRVRNVHDVEDIMQEALAKLVLSVNEKYTDENLEARVLQIAKCKVAEFCEQKAKDGAHIEWSNDMERLVETLMVANGESYSAGELEEQEHRSQRLERVKEAIGRMSRRLSAPLMMHAEGWSSPQIAEHLGMTEEAVRTNICRARKELVQLLLEESP